MKKVILVVIIVMFSSIAWANGQSTPTTETNITANGGNGYGGQGGKGGDGGNAVAIAGGGSATIQKGAVDNKNTNTNLNTNLNSNKNIQGQKQNQSQGQSLFNSNAAKADASAQQSIEYPREAIGVPAINMPTTSVLSGEIYRYKLLPKFANLALTQYNNELVVKTIYYSYGNIFSRITPEELPDFLMEKAADYKTKINIRYDVICKKSSHNLAVGTGGSGSTTTTDGNISTGGVLGAAGGWTVVDSYCAIWLYEIQ
jgi:hypothetical protein